jgi:hypothetical protein
MRKHIGSRKVARIGVYFFVNSRPGPVPIETVPYRAGRKPIENRRALSADRALAATQGDLWFRFAENKQPL